MGPSINNDDPLILGLLLILVFLMAELENPKIKTTGWFANNNVSEL